MTTQNPFAVIFGCADSRLAAEIIFDVGLGDVFVMRTAGHVIDDAVLGSLEYAISVLHFPLIVVLEHVKETVCRLVDNSQVIFDAVDNYSTAVVGLAYQLEEGRAQLVSTAGVL